MDCLSTKELDADFGISSVVLVRGTAVWLYVMELTGTGYLALKSPWWILLVDGGMERDSSVTYSFVFKLCSGASSYKEESSRSTQTKTGWWKDDWRGCPG